MRNNSRHTAPPFTSKKLSTPLLQTYIERLHVVSLMMSHDVIKFNFHTMSLPILLDIGSCPEKLQIKFESVSSYG